MATLFQVMTREPASPRQLNPAVPRDLETITLKCLEKDPARRYPSAQELSDELQRFLDGRPIMARPLGAVGRGWRWCRRNRALAATIAAAACLILAISGMYVVNLNAKNVQLAASLENEETARQQADANARTAVSNEKRAEDNSRQANEALEREKAQRLATERQSRVANALRLAAQSQQTLNVDPQQSLLLAVEAIQTTLRHGEPRLPAAEQALRDGLANVGGSPLLEDTEPIRFLAISRDGRWLATGSSDTTARLWDLTAKDPAGTAIVLRGHDGPVECIAIGPDSRWLVTGSHDKTARLWDLTVKDPAATSIVLRGHEDRIQSVAVSPDCRWAVTGSCGTARLWPLHLEELMDLARRTAGRELTAAERRQHLLKETP